LRKLRMSIDRQSVLGKLARHSWVTPAWAALAVLLLAPGLAWALDEAAPGCSRANPVSHWALADRYDGLTTGGIGQLPAPCSFALPFAWDGSDSHTSAADQLSGTTDPEVSPVEDSRERLKINPVTGLGVASESNFTPLTGTERWKLYFKMNYWSVGAYFGPLLSALVLDQTADSPYRWGGGFRGYGRRAASRVGNAILQGTFQAPVAALLHEDVRYISSSQQGFKRRAKHAILYSFLTYNSQGHPTLNIANLGSYYAATAVSTAWLPGIPNTLKYTLSNSTEQIALSVPVNLLQEYWPEIRKYVLHWH